MGSDNTRFRSVVYCLFLRFWYCAAKPVSATVTSRQAHPSLLPPAPPLVAEAAGRGTSNYLLSTMDVVYWYQTGVRLCTRTVQNWTAEIYPMFCMEVRMNRIDEFTKENVKDIWVWCKVMNDRLTEVNDKLDLLLKLAKVEESHRPQTQEPQQAQRQL